MKEYNMDKTKATEALLSAIGFSGACDRWRFESVLNESGAPAKENWYSTIIANGC
jgi:hypothetical protein